MPDRGRWSLPLCAVLAMLARREEARGTRLRRGPPPREGPTLATLPTEATAGAALLEATETETQGAIPPAAVLP